MASSAPNPSAGNNPVDDAAEAAAKAAEKAAAALKKQQQEAERAIRNARVSRLASSARNKDWEDVFTFLDEEGLDVDYELRSPDYTLLHHALKQGRADIMEALYARGASLDATTHTGQMLVRRAIEGQSLNALRFLQKHNYDFHAPIGTNQQSALHIAAFKRWYEGVDYLLNSVGISANVRAKNDSTPIMEVSSGIPVEPSFRVLNLLLDHKAQINVTNKNGERPISKALSDRSTTRFAQFFLDCDVDFKTGKAAEKAVDIFISRGKSAAAGQLAELLDRYAGQHCVGLDFYQHTQGKERFWKENKFGRNLFDAPHTWKRVGDLFRRMKACKFELSLADLLQTNPEGVTYLQRAIECRAGPQILEHLAEQGEHLNPGLLGDAEGNLTPLGKAVYDYRVMDNYFMQESTWKDRSIAELSAFYRKLPETLQNEFTNYPRILASKKQNITADVPGRAIQRER